MTKIFLASALVVWSGIAASVSAEPSNRQHPAPIAPDIAGVSNERTALLALSSDDDWEKRWQAAGWLSYGASPAGRDALIVALDNPEDWRLVITAAEALGRLREKKATAKLQYIRQNHWYPPVRTVAAKALAVIEGKETYRENWRPSKIAFSDSEFESVASDPITSVHYPTNIPTPNLSLGSDALGMEDLAFHAYPTSIGLHHEIETRPKCGLRLAKGFLLGDNRGEWGGELVWEDPTKAVHLLVPSNTLGIHRADFGIVAITGLAHGIITRDASIYRLVETPEHKWTAKRWRTLPGAPKRSGFLPDGRLFIACDKHVAVTVSPDGTMALFESNPAQ